MKKEYWIHVKHVDNRLVIFFNGDRFWDSGIIHDDPELDVNINITDQLLQHINHPCDLIFEGFNDAYSAEPNSDDLNPWHFEYRVFTRVVDGKGSIVCETDMINPYREKHLSDPNVRAINNAYRIARRDNEFKVVSNRLTQNFHN